MKKRLFISLLPIIIIISVACIKKELTPEPSGAQAQLKYVAQDTIRIVIMWGQSNAKGIANFGFLPAELQDTIPYSLVYLRDTKVITGFHHVYANGQTGSTSYGAQMRLMYELGQRDSMYRCLVQCGLGGTYISQVVGSDWNTLSPNNEYFYKNKTAVKDCRNKLVAAGHPVIYESFVLNIGESDATDSLKASQWYANANAIHTALKTYLAAPNLKMIVVRVHDVSPWSYIVRDQQVQLGTTGTNQWQDTDAWVPANVHLNPAGYDSLGRALASKIH